MKDRLVMGRKRSAPPKIIVEYPVCDRPIDSAEVAHAFAADLMDYSVANWCEDVRQAIAESKAACPASHRPEVAEEPKGSEASELQRIRQLRSELAALMEGSE